MTTSPADARQHIEALQSRYINALDQKDMAGWLGCFAGECAYICKTAEADQRGNTIALILDDCRERLEDRIQFVTRVWAGTFQDYQTRHSAQTLEISALSATRYAVRSNFMIMFTRSDTGKTDILASGIYRDEVLIEGPEALFASRTVVLDAPILPHYIVYPL